jgi:hypothetical protein
MPVGANTSTDGYSASPGPGKARRKRARSRGTNWGRGLSAVENLAAHAGRLPRACAQRRTASRLPRRRSSDGGEPQGMGRALVTLVVVVLALLLA